MYGKWLLLCIVYVMHVTVYLRYRTYVARHFLCTFMKITLLCNYYGQLFPRQIQLTDKNITYRHLVETPYSK